MKGIIEAMPAASKTATMKINKSSRLAFLFSSGDSKLKKAWNVIFKVLCPIVFVQAQTSNRIKRAAFCRKSE